MYITIILYSILRFYNVRIVILGFIYQKIKCKSIVAYVTLNRYRYIKKNLKDPHS